MRRTRFTVYQPGRNPFVVLAYTPVSVQRVYPGAAVERGDFRRKPPTDGGGWRVNHAAVAKAADLLGITWPIDIRTTSRYGNQRGNHQLRYRGGSVKLKGTAWYGLDTATDVYHRISVKSYLSTEQAGRTLWHELTHAMQAEREAAGIESMFDINQAWAGCARRGRYQSKPIEVEAREFEQWNDDHPLARAR